MEKKEVSPEKIRDLENALEGRLFQWQDNEWAELSRSQCHSKANSVTAGWKLRDAIGQEAFNQWVDRFYDTEIFHLSKPANELPLVVKKRRLETSNEEKEEGDEKQRVQKQYRCDPATIHDKELLLGMLHCTCCSQRFKTKEACYLLPNHEEKLVCLKCWQQNETDRYCATCHAELAESAPPPLSTYSFYFSKGIPYESDGAGRCPPCARRARPTTVVHLKRTKDRIVQNCDVYIGRRCTMGGWQLEESIWHNPFKVANAKKATPEEIQEVLQKYEAHVRSKPNIMSRLLSDLQGRSLGCWCVPKPCHGNVLVKLVNEALLAQETGKQ